MTRATANPPRRFIGAAEPALLPYCWVQLIHAAVFYSRAKARLARSLPILGIDISNEEFSASSENTGHLLRLPQRPSKRAPHATPAAGQASRIVFSMQPNRPPPPCCNPTQ